MNWQDDEPAPTPGPGQSVSHSWEVISGMQGRINIVGCLERKGMESWNESPGKEQKKASLQRSGIASKRGKEEELIFTRTTPSPNPSKAISTVYIMADRYVQLSNKFHLLERFLFEGSP